MADKKFTILIDDKIKVKLVNGLAVLSEKMEYGGDEDIFMDDLIQMLIHVKPGGVINDLTA